MAKKTREPRKAPAQTKPQKVMPPAQSETARDHGWMIFVFVVVLVIIGACVAAVCNADVATAHDATCKIANSSFIDPQSGKRGTSTGTGVVFEQSQGSVFVLTNAHVVKGAELVECCFWLRGHMSIPLAGRVLVRVDELQTDAAIVVVPEISFGGNLPAIVRVAPRGTRLIPGQTIFSVGCARGAWATGFMGHVRSANADELKFWPPPQNGRSGSAIFDAEGNQIIGLLHARTMDDSEGIAVGLERLYEKLTVACGQLTQCGPNGCPPGAGQAPRIEYESKGPIGAKKRKLEIVPWPTMPPNVDVQVNVPPQVAPVPVPPTPEAKADEAVNPAIVAVVVLVGLAAAVAIFYGSMGKG